MAILLQLIVIGVASRTLSHPYIRPRLMLIKSIRIYMAVVEEDMSPLGSTVRLQGHMQGYCMLERIAAV